MHMLHHFRVAKELKNAAGADFIAELVGDFRAADCAVAASSNNTPFVALSERQRSS